MRRIVTYLISFLFFFQSSLFAYSSNPKDFINELVSDAISKLADKNLNKDQKADFIEKVALDNVDINALGLNTLGELTKSSSKTNRPKDVTVLTIPLNVLPSLSFIKLHLSR